MRENTPSRPRVKIAGCSRAQIPYSVKPVSLSRTPRRGPRRSRRAATGPRSPAMPSKQGRKTRSALICSGGSGEIDREVVAPVRVPLGKRSDLRGIENGAGLVRRCGEDYALKVDQELQRGGQGRLRLKPIGDGVTLIVQGLREPCLPAPCAVAVQHEHDAQRFNGWGGSVHATCISVSNVIALFEPLPVDAGRAAPGANQWPAGMHKAVAEAFDLP